MLLAGVGVKVERPQRSEDERPWPPATERQMLAGESRQDQPTVATSLLGMGGVGALSCAGAQPYLGARAAGPAT
jgi:hypothetical protein